MPSTPTTKSQVHAYQFVVRRMESALVRKDAVMLHEPTRTHTRATAVGVILAVVGVLGFLIFGLLNPKGTLPENGIVISKQSGAVYVAMSNPRQLVPVPNMASAKLLLIALSGGSGGAPAGDTTSVDESEITDIPRGALTGIPGAPELLPTDQQRVSSEWAVCDQLTLKPEQPKPEETPDIRTTVLAGVPQPGRKLKEDEGLLLKAPGGVTFLVFTSDEGKGLPGAAAVRARVDLKNQAVVDAFRLDTAIPRLASTALINAIPEVQPLAAPTIPGKGEPTSYTMNPPQKVGSVVQVQRAGTDSEYYLLLKDGKQRLPRAVADLIRFAGGTTGGEWPNIDPSQVTNAPNTNKEVNLKDFPSRVPSVLSIGTQSVACLSWAADGAKERTAVTVGTGLPMPSADMKPVDLAQADGNGDAVDSFFMPPGKAAVVRAASSPADFDKGTIFLVSDRGVKFGIPTPEIAEGLGLGKQFAPAPISILGRLPEGPAMNPRDAARMFDAPKLSDENPVRRPAQQGQGN